MALKFFVIREFSKPKRWNAKGMQRAYCFFHIYTFLDSDFSTLIENRNNFQFWQDFCVKSWLFPFTNFMSCRRLRLFFFFIGTHIIIPYSFFVCKTVGWVDIGHHFDSFPIATTTLLTTIAYLCHKHIINWLCIKVKMGYHAIIVKSATLEVGDLGSNEATFHCTMHW
jgi:hypothetical protein